MNSIAAFPLFLVVQWCCDNEDRDISSRQARQVLDWHRCFHTVNSAQRQIEEEQVNKLCHLSKEISKKKAVLVEKQLLM
jgi:Ran GTPase-activating protein (RanGAP) involved in mRNA processing and transport